MIKHYGAAAGLPCFAVLSVVPQFCRDTRGTFRKQWLTDGEAGGVSPKSRGSRTTLAQAAVTYPVHWQAQTSLLAQLANASNAVADGEERCIQRAGGVHSNATWARQDTRVSRGVCTMTCERLVFADKSRLVSWWGDSGARRSGRGRRKAEGG